MRFAIDLSTPTGLRGVVRQLFMVALLLIGGGIATKAHATAHEWDTPRTVSTTETGAANDMNQTLVNQTTGLAQWIFGPLMWIVVGLVILAVIVGVAMGSAKIALYGITSVFVGVFLVTAVQKFLN